MEKLWDSSFEKASLFSNKVCEAIFVNGCGGLLKYGAFNQIVCIERGKVTIKNPMGFGDLELSCIWLGNLLLVAPVGERERTGLLGRCTRMRLCC